MNTKWRNFFWAISLCFSSLPALAQQEPQQIEVLNANIYASEKMPDGIVVGKLLGDVRIKQDSTLMYCDSAYRYPEANKIDARSHVRIVMSSGVVLTADRIIYDGNTRIAELYNNIDLNDGKTNLHTNRMTYYRNQAYGYYQHGGIITQKKDKLTSRRGFYHADRKFSEFRDSVHVITPEYLLVSDSLNYENEPQIVHFICPTRIYGKKKRTLYTERGYYRSQEKETFLYRNSSFADSTYRMYADTIYYADLPDTGWAHCRVQIQNKDTTLHLYGERSVFHRRTGQSLMTENAYMIQRLQGDTLTLFADTLYSLDDSIRGKQQMNAWHHVRFTMSALQGKADSLDYNRIDSIMTFYHDPVMWAEQNQLSGDTVRIWIKQKQADSLRVYSNTFVASRENNKDFNQIQGKQMYGKLRNNKLVMMHVVGNAQSLYFTKEGKKETGMNQSYSKELFVYLKDNKPKRIKFVTQASGTFYPLNEVADRPNQLSRFAWRIAERPKRYLGLTLQQFELQRDTLPAPVIMARSGHRRNE